MQMPTSEQVHAGLSHVYSGVAGASAALIFIGMSQVDTNALSTGIHQIGDGVASIVAGVTTLIPVALGLYAAYQKSPLSKLLDFKKNKQIAQVLAVPGTPMAALADAIPGDKITVATSTLPPPVAQANKP
jgi:hypothetical protein